MKGYVGGVYPTWKVMSMWYILHDRLCRCGISYMKGYVGVVYPTWRVMSVLYILHERLCRCGISYMKGYVGVVYPTWKVMSVWYILHERLCQCGISNIKGCVCVWVEECFCLVFAKVSCCSSCSLSSLSIYIQVVCMNYDDISSVRLCTNYSVLFMVICTYTLALMLKHSLYSRYS